MLPVFKEYAAFGQGDIVLDKGMTEVWGMTCESELMGGVTGVC